MRQEGLSAGQRPDGGRIASRRTVVGKDVRRDNLLESRKPTVSAGKPNGKQAIGRRALRAGQNRKQSRWTHLVEKDRRREGLASGQTL